MSRKIYLDNAATKRVKKEVIDEMGKYFDELYGNPSSQLYELGRKSKEAIEKSRKTVADFLNAEEKEIYFTAGGTESDNWALKGVAFANFNKGKNHIITTKIEHHAIIHTCEYLEKFGIETTYLDVDRYGLIDLEKLEEAIRPETMLISIMFANNEIGTIQHIEEIGEIAKKNGVLFHVDAVQALGSVRIDVKKQHIDLMSMSAHKISGPKGVGALYIKKGTKIDNFIHGGGQERGRRAGTEGVQNIVGFGKAVEIAARDFNNNEKLTVLRNRLIEGIKNNIPDVVLNGHPTQRLPNNVNFSYKYVEGESILLLLDMEGIAASSGSACTSGSLDPSHVLLAIGLDHGTAHGSIRFTLSEEITEEDIDFVVETMKKIITKLRAMSPIKNDEDLKKN